MSPTDAASGDFGRQVYRALIERGWTIRAAAKAMAYDHAFLSRVISGKQTPSIKLASSLDSLLNAKGELVKLASAMDDDDRARIRAALDRPTRIDAGAVSALADSLAVQRRLDDALGPTPLIDATEAQVSAVITLLKSARGPHRDALAEVVAEFVQFDGWLHASARFDSRAVTLLSEASELADEVDSPTLAAQALNFRGYLARQQRNSRGVARWFSAAYHTPGAHPAQRMGDAAQAAQGYAELGEVNAARRLLDEALSFSGRDMGEPPRTAYWLTPTFQLMNLGLAYLGLHEYGTAADLIRSGLDGLPAEHQAAEWAQEHHAALATAETHR